MAEKFCEFWNEVICPLAKGDISIKPLLVAGIEIYIMLIGIGFIHRFRFEIKVRDLISALFYTPYVMFTLFWGLMFANENVFILFVPVYPLIILRIISINIKKHRRRGNEEVRNVLCVGSAGSGKAFSVIKPVENGVGMSYCELMSANSLETEAENIVVSDPKNEVLPEK